jgi:hypothetical protein
MPLITDSMVSAAFDYLNEAADAAAKARADRILAEHKRKKVLAELLLGTEKGSADLRKAAAEAHPDYWEACKAEAEAVRADSWHHHQKGRAVAVIEAWRTEQSNLRQTSRVG